MAHKPFQPGDARLGWLVDGSDQTPDISTMLVRSDSGLVLTVPWTGHDSPYERWFGQGVSWGDDPDRTRFRYEPPEVLWFVNPDGMVGLIDCYSLGSRSRLPGTGEGRIGVRMAVHGADVDEDYRRINGMQSTVPGLGLWLGKHAFDRTAERGQDGWLKTLKLSWTREAPIRVSRNLNLSFVQGFEFRDVVPGDQSLLEDRFRVQTLVGSPRSWTDHLDLHLAIRDLVALASWDPFDLGHLTVTRDSDPARTLDGASHGRQWLPAEVFVYSAGAQLNRRPRFLFEFADIGTIGVHRWLTIRKRHLRTVQPLVFSLRQSGVPLETHLLQVGAAVEALGYDLARQAGVSRSRAKDAPFADRASSILRALGNDLPASVSSWPDDLRRAYRAAKHAEHPLPSAEDAFHVLETTRLVLRLWFGRSLGVNLATLRRSARLERFALHDW